MRLLLTVLTCVLCPTLAVAQNDVRARLIDAARGTRELVASGQDSPRAPVAALSIDVERERLSRHFPRRPDVPRYTDLRPWTRSYSVRLAGFSSLRRLTPPREPLWPQPADAPGLRALLTDPDPAVRGLAVEALATLYEPNDVPLIARLLDDEAISAPALGWNQVITATILPINEGDLDLLRGWYARSVKSYARIALRLMTGRTFDATSFAAWWPRNRDARAALWFWDERLKRALAESTAQSNGPGQDADRQSELLSTFREELRRETPELEAKVCLLAPDENWGLLGPCERLRLETGRLLDLLDRKDLWGDVDWDAGRFNALVVGIGRVAHLYFRHEHVTRLQSVMVRERDRLWWNGNAALRVGVSRLLPRAVDGALDDSTTREGFLRDVLRRDPELFVRREAAQELIRVDVARNWPLLEQQFFAEASSSGSDLRRAVLDELGTPPFTADKRTALARLLLDRRFEPLWTRQLRVMGDDMYRQTAIAAINAHAGREVLTVYDKQDLELRETSSKALARVRNVVVDILGRPR
jgi:hypothetical protein